MDFDASNFFRLNEILALALLKKKLTEKESKTPIGCLTFIFYRKYLLS